MANPNAGNRYLYCFTHSNIGTSAQITDKLEDLSHGITNDPPSGLKGRFSDLKKNTVLECVVGETHVAVLLEDGRICRIGYSEELPPLPAVSHPPVPVGPANKEKSDDDASTSSARSRGSSPGRAETDDRSAHAIQAWNMLRSNHSGISGSGRLNTRGRIWLRRGGRSLIARWPVIPASDVPDDLVEQTMAILQDKSRNTVIRELQRTNLDVNQTLNNLLSREEDDGDDDGGGGVVGLGIPSGEELLSLLGSGLVGVADEDLDEALGASGSGRGHVIDEEGEESGGSRESRVSLYEFSNPLVQSEVRSLVSLGDGAAGGGSTSSGTPLSGDRSTVPPMSSAGGSSRTGEREKRGSGGGSSTRAKLAAPTSRSGNNTIKKKEGPTGPLLYDGSSEWWGGAKDGLYFKHMAGLHSELYAVDVEGRLHGWAWSSPVPETEPNPLEARLGLQGEKIRMIAGKFLRASVVTESGKLATWVDTSVRGVAQRLELKAQTYAELAGEVVNQLHVSEVVSTVVTESNRIYWWGVMPFTERKQSIAQSYDKVRQFKYHTSASSSSGGGYVVQGSKVCVRSSPVYGAGGKAIHMKGAQLQCGVLKTDVVNPNLTDKCCFKVISGEEEASGGKERAGAPSRTANPGAASAGTAAEERKEQEEFPGGERVHLGSKRKHSEMTESREEEDKLEEWSLRDVIFVDHVTNLNVGVVVKLDGNYVAVHYPPLDGEELSQVDIGKCRLLRKDEVVLASEASMHLTPYYIQDHPKKLRPPPAHALLSVSCDLRGVHALYSSQNILRYVLFSLDTGKFHLNSRFSELSSKYLIKQGGPFQLVPINLSLGLIIDKYGSLFPISKNNIGNIKDLQLLNLPPVSSVSVGVCSNRNNLVGVLTLKQVLMPAILRCDLHMVRNVLDSLKGNPALLTSALKEHCSGGSNIFHVLAYLGKPPDPTPANLGEKKGVAARTTPRGGVIRAIINHAMALASGNSGIGSSSSSMDWASEDGDDMSDSVVVTTDTANDIVSLISSMSDYYQVLIQLLQERNLEGYTPFMAAVVFKAYWTARILLDLAEVTCRGQQEQLLSILYPPDSHPDDNPIFVLCRNDPCSFTWTGEEHIQQDIFECRTCGLTDSLCCCTECAYTCHRGHDCSFKRSSPKAYCDCWEKNKCHSLAEGGTYARKSLLNKLLSHTDLSMRFNGRHQHIVGMLTSTVIRQQKEQAHYTGLRTGSSYRSGRSHSADDIPIYDLSPPKFAQKGLGMVLENWSCVRALVMCDAPTSTGGSSSEEEVWSGVMSGMGSSKGQTSTVSLDAFTHLLLTKLNLKVLDSLLTILVAHIGPARDRPDGVEAANRFLRSVIRVYTVCHLELSSIPTPPSIITITKRKVPSHSNTVIDRARRIFSSLAALSLKQMIPMAHTLILPVSTGITRAVDPLCMSDRHETSEEMFRLPPVSLLRVPPCEEEVGGDGGVADQDTESEMGEGEDETLAPSMDHASSLAAGSNLLYLSDQESSDAEDLDSGGDDMSMLDYRMEEEGLLDQPPAHHRSSHDSHWALPSSRRHPNSPHHQHQHSRLARIPTTTHRSPLNVGTSASLLAKAFSLLIHQVADTLDSTRDMLKVPTPPYVLHVDDADPDLLYDYIWDGLHDVWAWLFRSMDVLESQLRFGTATCRKLLRTPPHKTEASSSSSSSLQSRRDLFGYMLTLMRGQFQEHAGILPAVDVASMEHLAWCFDALMYLLQHARPPAPPLPDAGIADITQETVSADLGSNSTHLRFFRRSDSIVCLGTVPLSPFDPVMEALPLAEKPHLLDGTQDKEMLFGYQMSTLLQDWPKCPLPPSPIRQLFALHPGGPGKVWPRQTSPLASSLSISLSCDEVCGWNNHKLTASILVGRWGGCIEVFSQAFIDTVGRQKHSILSQDQHFKHREREFKRDMDYLRATCHKEIVLEVDRARDKFLPGLFTKLNEFGESHPSTGMYSTPPFCVHRVKVTFVGEPGEGSGVLRSLFTAAGEAVLLEEPLPLYDLLPPSIETGEGGRGGRGEEAKSGTLSSTASISDPVMCPPLFYQPGKAGYYAPRAGSDMPLRLNYFRNVGRMMGLCLLHTEVIPLTLCRHVYKFLINRTVSWHDLAFFDSDMYEGLRKMVLNSREENGAELLASMGLNFSVMLSPEEGGRIHELVEGGTNMSVTPGNVYDYVQKYAELRMTGICWEPLNEMRLGLQEVVPKTMLTPLSAEDLRLMLCGTQHIDVDLLRSITVFDDESHKEMEMLARFKGWFWATLERMTQHERQDLLYFWSSSPLLPASVESYQPRPSVTIRPPDDQQFPTANTCISRLYLPLYTSKTILRSRLLTAIKTKTFGFV